MAPIVCDVEIARPPDEVFAYVTDPAKFGEWQSGVVSARIEGDGPPAIGHKCLMTRRLGGGDRTSVSEITAIDPPRAWAIHGVDGPIRADVGVAVEPGANGAGSHVTITIDFSGHGFGKMILPLVLREARKEAPQNATNLKHKLEAG